MVSVSTRQSREDSVEYLPAIQKLFGSFKGDAFKLRVLPFFHECNDVYLGVLLTRLRGMPWNASAVELRFEAP